jgi:membrane-associated protein
MELIRTFVDFFLHLDTHLHAIIAQYGVWTYLILFLIVFAETGLVVAPLLPGDSLLFAVGAIAAAGTLNVGLLFVLLAAAAIVGDSVNYWIGNYVGPRVFQREDVRFLNKKHLDRTHEFYERHGGKTIIIARFLPILRTFAPFVAGIGAMTYSRFMTYNVVGALLWVSVALGAGYAFGNLPVVEENFTLVIVAIVLISIMPVAFEAVRQRLEARGPKSPSLN